MHAIDPRDEVALGLEKEIPRGVHFCNFAVMVAE